LGFIQNMSYYLVISFIIAIIAIIYIWYMTRSVNTIPDTTILALNTADNYLLESWYKRFAKPSLVFDINEYETAARLLKRLYDIDVDPNLIVIGENLSSQYYQITQMHLSSHTNQQNSLENTVYDIRSAIGVNYDIAIINNPRVRATLRRNNTVDLSETIYIMSNELDVIARDYLKQILKYRWDKINEISDPSILNAGGTFLYLRECNIPNIETISTPFGFRINLLCNDLEFETLIKRWSSSRESLQRENVLPSY
jgi:hypothetical protein